MRWRLVLEIVRKELTETLRDRRCQALDGIPLALEMAAARLNILSLEQNNTQVSDALHL